MILTIGAVLAVCGVLAVVGGVVQKMRVGRLGETPFHPTGAVATQGASLASPKGGISAQGNTQVRELLTSPITQTPCLYYKAEVKVEWKDGEEEISKTLTETNAAVPFAIDDGSGAVPVRIDAATGGEFDCDKPFDGKKFSRGMLASMTGKPLEVTPHFSIPADVTVPGPLGREIKVPSNASFIVTEHVLPAKPFFYVNGKLQDDGSIGSPKWASLLIKHDSRDKLLGDTAAFAKKLFVGGGVAGGIGAILAVVGLLTKPARTTEASQAAKPVAAAGAARTGGQPGSLIDASGLRLTGDCDKIAFVGGMQRVDAANGGLSLSFIDGAKLARLLVILPDGADYSAGANLEVCQISGTCKQNIQVGDNQMSYVNTGAVAGVLDVASYEPASGKMELSFENVQLSAASSDNKGTCTINGTLKTHGLSK